MNADENKIVVIVSLTCIIACFLDQHNIVNNYTVVVATLYLVLAAVFNLCSLPVFVQKNDGSQNFHTFSGQFNIFIDVSS